MKTTNKQKVRILFLPWMLLFGIAAQAADKLDEAATRSRLAALAKGNNLDSVGATPWHLRMTYELRDAYGKGVVTTGVVEEWWLSPGRFRRTVESPTYHLSIPNESDAGEAKASRESTLVQHLVDETVHPVFEVPSQGTVRSAVDERNLGARLSCIAVDLIPTMPGSSKATASGVPLHTYCTPAGSDVVRMASDNTGTSVRNKMGTFHGVAVAQEPSLSYNGKVIISGRIDVLQGIDPATVSLPAPRSEPTVAAISGGVVAGALVRKQNPVYPEAAKMNHLGGSVILAVIIGVDGRIQSMDILASPAPVFDQPSLDAVRQWTYEPYLLNGRPTSVDATITVNYNVIAGSPNFR